MLADYLCLLMMTELYFHTAAAECKRPLVRTGVEVVPSEHM